MKIQEVLEEKWDADKVKEYMDNDDDALVWRKAIQSMPKGELKRLAGYMKKAGRSVSDEAKEILDLK